jgi:hypothetical protein
MAALSVDGTPMPALPNSADQINYDNTTSGLSATTVKGAVDELASEKQDATDNNLTTTNKTIVGGINEVKCGLNDANSKITSFTGYATSGKWYKIATFTLNDFSWFSRTVIVACDGGNIKSFYLRATQTDGFNNNNNSVNQIIGASQIGGLKFSDDYKSISILLKASATGDIQYTVLSQSGELRNVVFNAPVETDYTDSDIDVIN